MAKYIGNGIVKFLAACSMCAAAAELAFYPSIILADSFPTSETMSRVQIDSNFGICGAPGEWFICAP